MFRNLRLLIPLVFALVVVVVLLINTIAGVTVAVVGGILLGAGFVLAGRRRRA